MSINPVAAASIIMLVLLFLKVPVFASVFAAAAAYFFLMPDCPATDCCAAYAGRPVRKASRCLRSRFLCARVRL